MKLRKAQLALLHGLAAGGQIVRRGETIGGNPAYVLKSRNGTEKPVNFGTVNSLIARGLIDSEYAFTPVGRAAVTT